MAFRKKPATSAGTAHPRRGWFVASRATFWIFWSLSTLASTAFAVLALLSFAQMHRIHNTANFTGRRQIRGPMAAEFFGAVAVVFTNLLAFMTLLWKTARRNGTGFGYGYVVASYGITGLWLVLSGIVMWAGNDTTLWSTTSHWGHGRSVAYTAAYLLAWATAGIYLLTWAILFFFRKSFSQPAAVMGDAETGMASAYPAATTYSSPAFANSPKAAATGAPATASKGRFWRKQHAAPLAAGAPAAAATSNETHNTSNTNMPSRSATTQQQSTGPLGNAAVQSAPDGATGAFPQYHRQHRADEGNRAGQEQPLHAVPESRAEGGKASNFVYAREAEMGPVGPHGAFGGSRETSMTQAPRQRQDENRAGFFQS